MKTFIADIIPKIQRYSQKLDNLALLSNQHWVVFDNINTEKEVYIFRSNNQLLISKNGLVEKGTWEVIGNKSLLIDMQKESFLFKHGFLDQNILALKLDGKEEYAFLINESNISGELNSLENITDFLCSNYLEKPIPGEITKLGKIKPKEETPKEAQMTKMETPSGAIFFEGIPGLMDGRRVYKSQDKEPAEDGKYKLGFMWYIYRSCLKYFQALGDKTSCKPNDIEMKPVPDGSFIPDQQSFI